MLCTSQSLKLHGELTAKATLSDVFEELYQRVSHIQDISEKPSSGTGLTKT